MIRAIAYLMIFVGISGAGFEYAKGLGNRKRWYEEFTSFIGYFVQEIEYGHYEFKECLGHTLVYSKGFFHEFIYSVLERVSACDGRGINEIWLG